jgi:hypothetical protein
MRSNYVVLLPKLTALLSSILFTLCLSAQTFDDPDAEIEGGLEVEADQTAAPADSQLDDALDENLQEDLPEEVDTGQQIETGDIDNFVPSEDISEDFSVPFPVDI